MIKVDSLFSSEFHFDAEVFLFLFFSLRSFVSVYVRCCFILSYKWWPQSLCRWQAMAVGCLCYALLLFLCFRIGIFHSTFRFGILCGLPLSARRASHTCVCCVCASAVNSVFASYAEFCDCLMSCQSSSCSFLLNHRHDLFCVCVFALCFFTFFFFFVFWHIFKSFILWMPYLKRSYVSMSIVSNFIVELRAHGYARHFWLIHLDSHVTCSVPQTHKTLATITWKSRRVPLAIE